ncbi:MAG: 3-methyl-2-oxobutanoate hydroxymethyltransferase [Candidatus Thorarchaeota archaeon]
MKSGDIKLARKTTHKIRLMKKKGKKIVMLTAYDAPTASILSECGVDMILVGDSVGNALLGYESTIPVTLDDIIHHSAAVARAKPDCLIVGDMPFMSYKVSVEQALENCSLMLQEGGAEAVKIEGASTRDVEIVQAIVDSGIPVMGHIGLTPQSIFQLGGYRVQGRTAELTEALVEQAKALEAAGAFSIVIELVPSETAKLITESISIPTIGIGAGPHCDGQVLVLWDMLGLFEDFKPKFVKKYANIRGVILDAVKEYSEEVRKGVFPEPEHSFEMSEEETGRLYGRTKPSR